MSTQSQLNCLKSIWMVQSKSAIRLSFEYAQLGNLFPHIFLNVVTIDWELVQFFFIIGRHPLFHSKYYVY